MGCHFCHSRNRHLWGNLRNTGDSEYVMNVQVLISAVVRQVTVLIAQLATSGGARAPLAQVANQVFLELAAELENQGVGRKVSADMFGMALRTYQRKVQRLTESTTVEGQSLWQAIFDFLSQKKVATRAQIMKRFHRDDEAIVRGVLHDLTESSLVFRSGSAENTVYRVATEEELGLLAEADASTGVDALVWATVYREGPVTRGGLMKMVALRPPELDAALDRLLADGRIQRETRLDGDLYHTREFLVPLAAGVGWEAAVLDHVQSMVRTVCRKLQSIDTPTSLDDVTGGSTYTFDVYPGHPFEADAYNVLRGVRERVGELREQIERYNAAHPLPEEFNNVVVYVGQCVVEQCRNVDVGKE